MDCILKSLENQLCCVLVKACVFSSRLVFAVKEDSSLFPPNGGLCQQLRICAFITLCLSFSSADIPFQTVETKIRHNVLPGLIWVQTETDGIPERIFQK